MTQWRPHHLRSLEIHPMITTKLQNSKSLSMTRFIFHLEITIPFDGLTTRTHRVALLGVVWVFERLTPESPFGRVSWCFLGFLDIKQLSLPFEHLHVPYSRYWYSCLQKGEDQNKKRIGHIYNSILFSIMASTRTSPLSK